MSDGGASISGYTVIATSADSSEPTLTLSVSPVTSVIMNGLTADHTYYFSVIAHNSAGDSQESQLSAPVTIQNAATYDLYGLTIPAGFPSPLTTGLSSAGVTENMLTPFTGEFVTSSDGQVIELLDMTNARIKIQHANGIIRKLRIRASQYNDSFVIGGNTAISYANRGGWLIEDVEIIGPEGPGVPDTEAIKDLGPDCIIRRTHITNAADGISTSGNMVVEDCLIESLHHEPGSHSDCIQTVSGNGTIIRRNTLIAITISANPGRFGYTSPDADGYVSLVGSPANACLQLGSQSGALTNLTVEDNFLVGGNYTLNANKSKEGVHGAMTGIYRRNLFYPAFRYGTLANTPAGITVEDSNVWSTTVDYLSPSGRYWNITAGTSVRGVTGSTSP